MKEMKNSEVNLMYQSKEFANQVHHLNQWNYNKTANLHVCDDNKTVFCYEGNRCFDCGLNVICPLDLRLTHLTEYYKKIREVNQIELTKKQMIKKYPKCEGCNEIYHCIIQNYPVCK
jgi:hypothetical protein